MQSQDLSVNIVNDIPAKYIMERNVSATQATLRKDYIEFFPENQVSYSPSEASEIRFNIASNDGFLIASESYFKFDFQVTGITNRLDTVLPGFEKEPDFYLAEGGVHSCFQEIEHRSNNISNMLHRSRQYNREFNLMMGLSQSEDHQTRFGAAYGDSASKGPYIIHPCMPQLMGQVLNASVNPGVAGNEFRLEYGSLNQLGAYDVVKFEVTEGGAYRSLYGIIRSAQRQATAAAGTVEYSYALLPTDHNALPADGQGPVDVGTRVYKIGKATPNERYVACDGGVHTYTAQMKTPILDPANIEATPVFIMKGGLHTYMRLAIPELVVKARASSNSDNDGYDGSINYKISNIRFVGRIATPHSQIKREYIDRFNSPEGIVWHIPGYFTQEINAGEGTVDNIQAPYGIRSARHIIAGLQPDFIYNPAPAGTVVGPSHVNDAMCTYIKSNISKFQFRIAAHQYPLREVLCEGANVAEPFRQLYNIFDRFSSSNNRVCMDSMKANTSIHERVEITQDTNTYTTHTDAKWFLIGADLSRDNGQFQQLCGADVSLTPLQMMVERTGLINYFQNNKCTWFLFLWYDQYWRLSAGTQTVMS